jgi:hypothetical protein
MKICNLKIYLGPACTGRNLQPYGCPDTQGAPEEVRGYPYIRLGPRGGGQGYYLTACVPTLERTEKPLPMRKRLMCKTMFRMLHTTNRQSPASSVRFVEHVNVSGKMLGWPHSAHERYIYLSLVRSRLLNKLDEVTVGISYTCDSPSAHYFLISLKNPLDVFTSLFAEVR